MILEGKIGAVGVDLEWAESKGFIDLGFVKVVTEFGVNGTHKGEEEGVHVSPREEVRIDRRLGDEIENETMGHRKFLTPMVRVSDFCKIDRL
jgi:hypothetical protein